MLSFLPFRWYCCNSSFSVSIQPITITKIVCEQLYTRIANNFYSLFMLFFFHYRIHTAICQNKLVDRTRRIWHNSIHAPHSASSLASASNVSVGIHNSVRQYSDQNRIYGESAIYTLETNGTHRRSCWFFFVSIAQNRFSEQKIVYDTITTVVGT